MKHLWSIICNRLIIDEQTNNATLVDVLEEIKIREEFLQSKEEVAFFFNFVSLWFVESDDEYDKETNVIIEFYSPNKNKLNEFNFSFALPKRKKRIRTNIKFDKFILEGSGTYRIKVKQDNTEVAEIPLEIAII
ncbi:MAG TPA: hypothetical protein PKU93_02640 [Candidatus Pacearchaeota archaeon]|nr:hypothetical protein [Candidatus Pacearchaeota archaeon]